MARTTYDYKRLDNQPLEENVSLTEDSPESRLHQLQTPPARSTRRILLYGLGLIVLLLLSFATGYYASRTGKAERKPKNVPECTLSNLLLVVLSDLQRQGHCKALSLKKIASGQSRRTTNPIMFGT